MKTLRRSWLQFIHYADSPAGDVVLFLLLAIVAVVSLVGCTPTPHVSNVPDSLPAVGSSVEKTAAHVESAERLNVAAKSCAGAQARPLMEQVSAEHVAAIAATGETRDEARAAMGQRAALEGDNVKLSLQLTEATSGWGYKLQLWVARVLWTLVGAYAVHIALGTAALFVPGGAGAILARIGVYLNPFAWFQSVRDNYYFRSVATAAADKVVDAAK